MRAVVRSGIVSFAVAAGLLLGASGAGALEITAKTAEQKHRKDIAKQVAKYTLCLVKAITKCEKGGGTSAVECDATTATVAYAGDMTLDPKNKQPAKFNDAVAKCDSKLALSKKGNFYTEIGCPGDCSTNPGTQQCANLAAFQASVTGTQTGSTKDQLKTLATAINGACGLDNPMQAETTQVRIDCALNNAAILSAYAKGLFKCQEKCENDYKDKKGNGGPVDLPRCDAGSPLADPNFATCDSAALSKALTKGALSTSNNSLVLPLVRAAINVATNGQYNKDNPVQEPDTDVCGNCGNGTREGAEKCDGADNPICGSACAADCTCAANVCGNDIRQGNEECDGTDDQACPGACTGACACP